MMAVILPIAIGLAIGIAFIVIFAIYSNSPGNITSIPMRPAIHISTVIIPANTSSDIYNTGYEPSSITVVLGINNTVRWTNLDNVPAMISADNYADPDFWNATGNHPAYILPNQSYAYNFTKPGVIGYHGKPWQRGTVIVLPTSGQRTPARVSCQENINCTYQLPTQNGTYPINFRFNGTIENISYNKTISVMNLIISPKANGTLKIAVPRALVDSKTISGSDDQYAVFINNVDTAYDEYSGQDSPWLKEFGISTDKWQDYRLLSIPIDKDSRLVEIVSTYFP